MKLSNFIKFINKDESVPLFLSRHGESPLETSPLRGEGRVRGIKKGNLQVIKYIVLIILILTLFFVKPLVAYERLTCVIHIDTVFSAGENTTLEEVAQEATDKNIDAIITGDHALMRFEYGIWPLRNVIRKTYDLSSVIKIGPDRYLNEIKRLESKYPDLLIIPGVETSAFYYWTGKPFFSKEKLTLNQWHKHLIVAGLKKADDYYKLPLISNSKAGEFNIFLLWPLLFIAVFLLFLRKKKRLLYPALLICILLLINNYPFKNFSFNPYSGPQGEKPYQNLIDYANTKGALTFWAHPEAPNYETPKKIGPVLIKTKPYPESIVDTVDYTGFALYGSGFKQAGKPGGYWDQALIEYCHDKREKPVWAIGEVDFGIGPNRLDVIKNMLWVKDKSEESVLESLKNGNFYVNRNLKAVIEDFYIESGDSKAICGQEIGYKDKVRIFLDIKSEGDQPQPIKIIIIKNGEIINSIEAITPVRLAYDDTKTLLIGMNYYRIIIEKDWAHKIALNPVFVKR